MPSLRFFLPLLAGMVLAYWLPLSGHQWMQTTAVAAGALAMALATIRKRAVSSLFLTLFSALLGAVLMLVKKDETALSPPQHPVECDAVVLTQPLKKGKTFRFDTYVVSVKGFDVKPFKAKAVMYSPNDGVTFQIGETIHAVARFSKPVQFAQSNFNYPRYLFTQGFKSQAFLFADDVMMQKGNNVVGIPTKVGLQVKVARFRERLRCNFSALGIDGDNLAVLSALTLGDKSLLQPSVREAYSVSGASHVLALSGLHMGIIFSLLTMFFSAFGSLRWWRTLSCLLVMATVWAYVVMVGMPTSAVRSAIMLSVCSLVLMSGRQTKTINSLALAAILVLAVNPMSLFDVGFQMSFMAVAFIVLYAVPAMRWINIRLGNRHVLLKWAAGMAVVSFAAQMGVAPLVACYFGRFSCFFLITNFVAVPLTVVLLYGSVLMVGLFFLPCLQQAVASVLETVVHVLNAALSFISSLPGSSIEGLHFSVWQVVVAYAVMFLLRQAVCLWTRNRVVETFSMPYPETRA